jgi:hypothetical protein
MFPETHDLHAIAYYDTCGVMWDLTRIVLRVIENGTRRREFGCENQKNARELNYDGLSLFN